MLNLFFLFFSPSGRIGRGKWWLANLVFLAIIAGLLFWAYSIGNLQDSGADTSPHSLMFGLALLLYIPLAIWSNFCVIAKRYHDRNKSAWWYFIAFVPFIGAIWQLIECGFLGGDLNDNDYGPGPGFDLGDEISRLRAEAGYPSLAPEPAPAVERPSVAWNAARRGETQRGPQTAQPSVAWNTAKSQPTFGKRV